MIPELKGLSVQEEAQLLRTPSLVTMLVAGADGKYNEDEIADALDLTRWKTRHARPDLQTFYSEVARQLPAQVAALRDELPQKLQDRQLRLTEEIENTNPILLKLPKEFAAQFYKSMIELAHHVAESSGGVLGYFSIGYAESKVVDLPMLKDPRMTTP